ncbi:MAG TPA: hypothetical protein VMB25_11805 [Bryobacteraceae bacterium]|nr:hypothetical protein [Bryobacteraceae bacterium]
MESASFAFRALHPNTPAHHVHQAVGDGEAQSGAAELARIRTVHLRKGFENHALFFQGNADSRVGDRAVQQAGIFGGLLQPDRDGTGVGELHRVSNQVGQHLLEPSGIAMHGAWDVRRDGPAQLQTFRGGGNLQALHRLLQQRA